MMDYVNQLNFNQLIEFLEKIAVVISSLGGVFVVFKHIPKKVLGIFAGKRNKLLSYYKEYDDLPVPGDTELTKNFIIHQLKSLISYKITKINDEYHRKTFMFIILNAKSEINVFVLRKVIKFIKIEGVINIDISKLSKSNVKNCILG
ncbi:hypothetical protein, partial [Providencia stuartii]|uniref:hypothetical protein n=1 Tax=Providencia stuartii TaxID=588 RepID=UPI002AA0C4D9